MFTKMAPIVEKTKRMEKEQKKERKKERKKK